MKVKYDFEAQVHTLTITPETDEEERQLQTFYQTRDSWVDELRRVPGSKRQQLLIHRA